MRKAAVAGAWIALILILGLAYRAAGGRFFSFGRECGDAGAHFADEGGC